MEDMKKVQIAQKVTEIIAENRRLGPGIVLGSDLLQDTLRMDSLDMVEACMCLEEEFSLNIDDEQLDKFSTVQDIIDYVIGQEV